MSPAKEEVIVPLPLQLLSGSDLWASTGKCVLATLLQPVFLSCLSTSHLFFAFSVVFSCPRPLKPRFKVPL